MSPHARCVWKLRKKEGDVASMETFSRHPLCSGFSLDVYLCARAQNEKNKNVSGRGLPLHSEMYKRQVVQPCAFFPREPQRASEFLSSASRAVMSLHSPRTRERSGKPGSYVFTCDGQSDDSFFTRMGCARGCLMD